MIHSKKLVLVVRTLNVPVMTNEEFKRGELEKMREHWQKQLRFHRTETYWCQTKLETIEAELKALPVPVLPL